MQILLHLKFHHVALCLLECIFSHPPPEKKRGRDTQKRREREPATTSVPDDAATATNAGQLHPAASPSTSIREAERNGNNFSSGFLPLYLLFSSEIPGESGGGSPLGLTLFFVSADKRPRFILSLPFFSVLLRRSSPEPSDEYSVPKFSGDNQRQKGGKDGRISRAENRIEERNFLHANFFDRV